MKFGSGYYSHHPMVDYFNSMDPQSYTGEEDHSGHNHEGSISSYGADLEVKDIGLYVPQGISAGNVAGI